MAKELITTTVATTTEEIEITTANFTGNETEVEDPFAAEEIAVLKDNPDPKLEEGDAYGMVTVWNPLLWCIVILLGIRPRFEFLF